MADKITYENKAVGVKELPPTPKKVITEPPEPKKQPKSDKVVAEIEVIKAHDGLEIGCIKRVQGNSATTIYMVENEYWRIK